MSELFFKVTIGDLNCDCSIELNESELTRLTNLTELEKKELVRDTLAKRMYITDLEIIHK